VKRLIAFLLPVIMLAVSLGGCHTEQQVTEAYNLGYESGYAQGYATGYAEGYAKGHTEGYNSGYVGGYAEGWNDAVKAQGG